MHEPSRSPSAHLPRIAATLAGLLLLASCTVVPNYYPKKGDAKPHPGVAKAQNFPIHGIDLSKWQSEIDWAEVKDAGTRFVFIKATEGGDHVEPGSRRTGRRRSERDILRGAYHFVYWCRPAEEQAALVREATSRGTRTRCLPVLDVEWNGLSQTCPRKVPQEQALAMIQTMLIEIERHTGKGRSSTRTSPSTRRC